MSLIELPEGLHHPERCKEYVIAEAAKVFSESMGENERRLYDGFIKAMTESFGLDKSEPLNEMIYQDFIRSVSDGLSRRKAMSPPGALGLPDFLERRRWEFGITDGYFDLELLSDRVLIYQIEHAGAMTTEGGLHFSERGKTMEEQSNPEGILVAAGLTAMDQLVCHGFALGHKVSFIKQAPFRKRVDRIGMKEKYAIMVQAGDVVGSFDLKQMLKGGSITLHYNRETREHFYVDKNGEMFLPSHAKDIELPGDY